MTEDIFTLDQFITPWECGELILKMEDAGFAPATTKEAGGQAVNTSIRNNERASSLCRQLSHEWMSKVRSHLPVLIDGLQLCSLWPEFRCYKYVSGNEFKTHIDWPIKDGDSQSLYTLMVYLNEGFHGGNTTFFAQRFDAAPYREIAPATGRALVFRQKGLYHSGSLVTEGIKYVLRTDVMYKPA